MKWTPKAVVGLVLLIAGVGLLYFAISGSGPQRGHVDARKLLAAARTYAADLNAKGEIVPPFVSLKDLIDRGLLTKSDVSGFAGMKVTISLFAQDNRPQDVLARARLPDGEELVLLVDGSVRQARK